MTLSRTHLTVGAAGLVAGLALGVTGLAQAADPTPSPSSSQERTFRDRMHERPGMPGGRMDKRLHGGYGGLVTAIDTDSLTVRTPDGAQTLALTGSTTFYEGKTLATRDSVTADDVVHVRLVDPQATKKVAAVVRVVPAHIRGWVTAVGDASLTIKDLSGFTRTARTSSATTYAKDGATVPRTAITVGTFVRALGEVAADGTSLEATRVTTGRPDQDDLPSPQ